MNRPKNVDIWDDIELKRDENLTDEQKEKLIQDTLKEVKESAERFKKSQGKKHRMGSLSIRCFFVAVFEVAMSNILHTD